MDLLIIMFHPQQTNMWIPLLAAMVGGFIAIFGTLINEKIKNNKIRKALAYAFVGEIKALMKINEVRGYREYLHDVIINLENGAESQHLPGFPITDDYYFLVYKKNIGHIGILPSAICESITLSYSLIFSYLEDVKSWCARNEPTAIANDLPILRNTLEILDSSMTEAEKALNLIEHKKCWWL